MITLTDEETAFGFAVRPAAEGYVVARELYDGLLAVKTIRDGEIEYALCDAELAPIYAPARTIDELRARFGVRHAS